MPSKMRLQRIADRIRQDLSEMIVMRVQDPRLSGVSITDVKVDRELAFADIYVSAIEGVERSREVLAGLQHASGYLRRELAAQIELRVVPRLRFHWDPTPERADRIERILKSLHEEQPPVESVEAEPDADAETDELYDDDDTTDDREA